VIILKEMLTNVEIVRFYLFLRVFNRSGHKAVLDRNTFFHAQSAHDALNPIGPEDTHQIIFQRQIKTRRPRIPLSSRPSAQLIIDAAALVTFRTKNVQSSLGDDSFPFFSTDTVVASQNFIETMAILVGRFVQLLANILDYPQVFLSLGFVVALGLLNSLFVWLADLFTSRFRRLEGLVNQIKLVHQRGGSSLLQRQKNPIKLKMIGALVVVTPFFI